MRTLLEGRVRARSKEDAFAVSPEGTNGGSESKGEGVPVPLGLCLAGAAMLLVAATAASSTSAAGDGSSGGSRLSADGDGSGGGALEALTARDREEALLWLWRVTQVRSYILS